MTLQQPGKDRTGPDRGFDAYRRKLGTDNRLPVEDQSRSERRLRTEPNRTPSARPNVLWIMADQLRADCMGFMNHPLVKTPNIDRLAERSAIFTNSFCSSPVCAPSRATMLSGLRLNDHGVLSNQHRINDDVTLLPNLLKTAGYRTANIGKHHAGCPGSPVWEHYQYVEDVFGATKPSKVPYMPQLYSDAVYIGDDVCDDADYVIAGTYPGPVETSKSYMLATETMKWVYYNDDPRPFFLRVSFDDPHPPVVPPEPFASMYNPADVPNELVQDWVQAISNAPAPVREYRQFCQMDKISEEDHRKHAAAYFGLISHLDAQIGRILDYFEKSEFADNTIILLNSDHGHMIGEYGYAGKGVICHEGVVRIPTLISLPGNDLAGRKIDELVEGVDLLPTIFDLLDIPIPAELDGQSWKPLLKNQPGFSREYARIQWHDFGHCLRGKRYKLIVYDTSPDDGELYDLREDPIERYNLFTDPAFADIISEMKLELAN